LFGFQNKIAKGLTKISRERIMTHNAVMNLGSPESAVRALLVSRDPPTIEQLSKSLHELAASTEVCTDIPNAIRLVNTRKFETVVVDLKLGGQSRSVLERVRLSPSNHTTVAFAITQGAKESAMAFEAGSNFVFERPLSPLVLARTFKAAYALIVRERLRYFRYPTSIPATIGKDDQSWIQAEAVNISQGGVAIVTSASLKSGSKVNVQLTIPGHASQLSVESEVCWCDAKGRAGLRFLSLSEQQTSDLNGWLSRMLEQSLPESVAMKFRSTT
jgi:CheY-like chemotaxis protein